MNNERDACKAQSKNGGRGSRGKPDNNDVPLGFVIVLRWWCGAGFWVFKSSKMGVIILPLVRWEWSRGPPLLAFIFFGSSLVLSLSRQANAPVDVARSGWVVQGGLWSRC